MTSFTLKLSFGILFVALFTGSTCSTHAKLAKMLDCRVRVSKIFDALPIEINDGNCLLDHC